jgi:DNA uptake protein ComE-like DNA-binding protein
MKARPAAPRPLSASLLAAALGLALVAALPTMAATPQATPKPDPTQPSVDINTATEQSLQQDLGLDAESARAIIRHRQAHGPLTSEKELRAIRGLAPDTAAKLKGRLMFSSHSTTGEPDTVAP